MIVRMDLGFLFATAVRRFISSVAIGDEPQQRCLPHHHLLSKQQTKSYIQQRTDFKTGNEWSERPPVFFFIGYIGDFCVLQNEGLSERLRGGDRSP